MDHHEAMRNIGFPEQPQETHGDSLDKEEKKEKDTTSSPELDGEAQERVSSWSRQWLDELYTNSSDRHGRDMIGTDIVGDSIARLTGDSAEYQQGVLTPRYSNGVAIFFHELTQFVNQRSGDPEKREQLLNFLDSVQGLLFSYSPNITNHLSLDNQLLAAAEATRVPEVQGWFGQAMIGEVVYGLRFSGEGAIKKLIDRVDEQPLPLKLDVIHQLQTVAAQAVANGDWAEGAYQRVSKIIQELERRNDSPILGYTAELALERVRDEAENPSVGLLKYHGDRREGRIVDSLQAGGEAYPDLTQQLETDAPTGHQGRVQRIAQNAIGVFDHSDILRFWGKVDPGVFSEKHPQTVHVQPAESLETDTELNPFAETREEEASLLLQHLHRPALRQKIEQNVRISFSELPLRSQVYFLKYLAGSKHEGFSRMKDALASHPAAKNEIAQSFLSIEQDSAMGNTVLAIAERLDDADAKKLFSRYATMSQDARAKAEWIHTDFAPMFPQFKFSEQEMYESLMLRAKSLLTEVRHQLDKGPADIDEVLVELKKENALQEMLRVQFIKIAETLGGDHVDLNSYRQRQELILESLQSTPEHPQWSSEGLYLRALSAMGKLRPMPELFWRVDRRVQDYDRRLGIDTTKFLADVGRSRPGDKTLVEFGPGSGVAKHQRIANRTGHEYADFAMSDAVYYDPSVPMDALLDYEKMEKALGTSLTHDERRELVEYLKTVMAIEQGKTGDDTLTYDENTRQRLEQNPNAFKQIMAEMGAKISDAETIPTSDAVETPDGPRYLKKRTIQQLSPAVQRARELLTQDMKAYTKNNLDGIDLYDHLNAHPAGIILGEFNEVARLKDEQIDVALGVRSTVYVERKRYGQFIQDVCAKLKDGGIYIDDNVRENFGRYYRFTELQQVEKDLQRLRQDRAIDFDISIFIIIGKGIEGEDYKQEDAPLSVVIARGTAPMDAITSNLQPGCRIVPLDDVLLNKNYLRSLDAEGGVEQSVQHDKAA